MAVAEGRTLAWAQAQAVTVDCARRRHGEPCEIVGHGARIEFQGRDARGGEGVEFRSEQQPRAGVAVVERFDPERIARERERLLAFIPDREGKHPAQAFDRVFAPSGEGREQHLRVALRAEGPAGRRQHFTKRAEIVDRAVEHEGEPAVGRLHWLAAVGRIEDREPAHAQRRTRARCHAAVIRPAVLHGGTHAADRFFAGLHGGCRIDESGYAAHARRRGVKPGWLRPVPSSEGMRLSGWGVSTCGI